MISGGSFFICLFCSASSAILADIPAQPELKSAHSLAALPGLLRTASQQPSGFPPLRATPRATRPQSVQIYPCALFSVLGSFRPLLKRPDQRDGTENCRDGHDRELHALDPFSPLSRPEFLNRPLRRLLLADFVDHLIRIQPKHPATHSTAISPPHRANRPKIDSWLSGVVIIAISTPAKTDIIVLSMKYSFNEHWT